MLLLVAGEERLFRHRHPLPKGKPLGRAFMAVVCAGRGGLVANLTRMASFVHGEVEDGLAGLPGGLGAKPLPEVAAAQGGEEEEEAEGSRLQALLLGQGQEVLKGLVPGVVLWGLGQGLLEEAPDPGQGAVFTVLDSDHLGRGCRATFRVPTPWLDARGETTPARHLEGESGVILP